MHFRFALDLLECLKTGLGLVSKNGFHARHTRSISLILPNTRLIGWAAPIASVMFVETNKIYALSSVLCLPQLREMSHLLEVSRY